MTLRSRFISMAAAVLSIPAALAALQPGGVEREPLDPAGIQRLVADTGGALAPSSPQSVIEGDTVVFVVMPHAGFAIGAVDGCGGELDGETYTTAAVAADCAVTASFVVIDPIFGNGFEG